jgi:hypothetical protein
LVLTVLATVVCSGHAHGEEKKFTRLSGKEIRLKLIGKIVTDRAHWSDYFEKDGVLVSWSIGRRRTGKWTIYGDELCITEEADQSPTCYQVWIAGGEISFRLKDIETTFNGYLPKYEGE